VDNLDVDREIKVIDKEFIMPGGQIIGLDQAVLQSIERCRKYYKIYSHGKQLDKTILFYFQQMMN